jgi:hypothetical protein
MEETMNLIAVTTKHGMVYINPQQISWFWDHDGKLTIIFAGQEEAQKFDGTTAAEFAKKLQALV